MEHYSGRNILSYALGTPFSGKEIKNWIQWHMTHKCGEKTKMASAMKDYLNIEDNVQYCLSKNTYHSAENFGKYFVIKCHA